MKLDIKQLIADCSSHQRELRATIDEYKQGFGSEQAFSQFMLKLRPGFLYSPEVVNLIADSLQILESREMIEQFELDDVLSLYKVTLQNNPSSIENFKDFVFYKINVLCQTKDSLSAITDYVTMLKREHEELSRILQDHHTNDIEPKM